MSVPASIMRSVHQPPTPRPRYPSDLSDTAWSRIRGLVVPTHHKGGRPCSQARWREYVDALLYITRTGCPWRALPQPGAGPLGEVLMGGGPAGGEVVRQRPPRAAGAGDVEQCVDVLAPPGLRARSPALVVGGDDEAADTRPGGVRQVRGVTRARGRRLVHAPHDRSRHRHHHWSAAWSARLSVAAGSVRVVSRHTTFQLAADPSVEQERALARHEGAARFAFNQCLRLHLDARHQHTEDENTVESVRVPWSGFDFINAFNAWKRSEQAGRRFVV